MNNETLNATSGGPLSGKNALITGAAGGVGLAAARALAQTGADLCLSGIGAVALERAATEIRQEFAVEVETHIANTANAVEAEALALSCSDANIFVNCTGNIPAGRIDSIRDDIWRKAWEAAVFAPINMLREMWSSMDWTENALIIVVVDAPGASNIDDACASAGGGALMSLIEALGKEENAPRILGLVTGRSGDGASVAAAISRIACEPERFKSGTLLSPDAINAE